MSRTERLANRLLNPAHQLRREFAPRPHEQEQHHRFISILGSSLAHADRVCDFIGESRVDYVVDLGRPESDPGWVEHSIRAAEEEDLLRDRVDADEVAVRPDVFSYC